MKQNTSCFRFAIALAFAAFAASTVQALMSQSAFVYLQPETTSFWRTATNSVLALDIDYPEGAGSASLSVSGAGYSASYDNITTNVFELHLPEASSPETENVYDLTLTFDDGTVQRARLGLIQGLAENGTGSTRCIAPFEGRAWNKMRTRAVMPIPYGTTAFTVSVNGVQVAADSGLDGAQGWYVLDGIKRKDSVALSLVADGDETNALLSGIGMGYFFIQVK